MIWLKYFENFNRKWEILLSNPKKRLYGEKLIDLVENAYKKTNMGSFVNTISDVIKSNWYIIDWDERNDLDACIFYRKPRNNENWIGKKIQGIGHDGDSVSKTILINKLVEVLDKSGNWIEVSDKVDDILERKGCKRITDKEILEKLFPESKIIKIFNNGKYTRTLNNRVINESVYGKPKFK